MQILIQKNSDLACTVGSYACLSFFYVKYGSFILNVQNTFVSFGKKLREGSYWKRKAGLVAIDYSHMTITQNACATAVCSPPTETTNKHEKKLPLKFNFS